MVQRGCLEGGIKEVALSFLYEPHLEPHPEPLSTLGPGEVEGEGGGGGGEEGGGGGGV